MKQQRKNIEKAAKRIGSVRSRRNRDIVLKTGVTQYTVKCYQGLFHDYKIEELSFTGDCLRLHTPADHCGREIYEVREGEYLRVENDLTVTRILGVTREYYRILKRLDAAEAEANG